MEKLTHSVVPYQSPHARAIQSTLTGALGFLVAFALVAIPVVMKYLDAQAASAHTQLAVLGFTLGSLLLGVLFAYAANYVRASGSNVPPSVDPQANVAPNLLHGHKTNNVPAFAEHYFGDAPVRNELVALPALPMVDAELLVGLVNNTLETYLKAVAKGKESPAPTLTTEEIGNIKRTATAASKRTSPSLVVETSTPGVAT